MEVWLVPNLIPVVKTQVKGCERHKNGAVRFAPGLGFGTKSLLQYSIENVVLIFLLVSLP